MFPYYEDMAEMWFNKPGIERIVVITQDDKEVVLYEYQSNNET